MKIITQTAVSFFVLFFLSSCSSSRLMPHKFDEVALAAAEKFSVNEWTEFYTKKSLARERPGERVVFTHYDWTYHDHKIMCEVQVENEEGMAEVYVFVRDWNDWLSPFTYSPSYARKVLDLLERRMEDGVWPEPMPWAKDEGLR